MKGNIGKYKNNSQFKLKIFVRHYNDKISHPSLFILLLTLFLLAFLLAFYNLLISTRNVPTKTEQKFQFEF